MKADERRLRAAIERRPAELRLILLHGPDEAGAQAWAEQLAHAMGTDAERIDLDGATLKSDPPRLADEAASLSLFGGARFVRVAGAGEESLGAVTALLDAPRAGNPVVMIAPGVRTSGALVKAVIASDRALAHACYVPEGDQAEKIAVELARVAGLRLTRDAAVRLARAGDGDRAVMAREVEKLALFLDAAPERMVEADGAALDAIGASIAEAEMDVIVAAVIAGESAALVEALRLRAAGTSPIPLLRAVARRLIALAGMRAAIDGGEGADQAMKRHGVFWRDEGATRAALRQWTPAALADALATVRAAERSLMTGGTAGNVMADAALLALARGGEAVRSARR